jgi:hypothetical protein
VAEVVAVLIGAVIALVAQWFISPTIERRVRAHERWENDVLRLGELVSNDLRKARWELRAQFNRWSAFQDLDAVRSPGGVSETFITTGLEQVDEDASSVATTFNELIQVRLRWLVNRVLVGLPSDRTLEARWFLYETAATDVIVTWAWDPAKRNELEAKWDHEETERQKLLTVVEELSMSIGPPRGTRHQARRLWHGVKRKSGKLASKIGGILRRGNPQTPADAADE